MNNEESNRSVDKTPRCSERVDPIVYVKDDSAVSTSLEGVVVNEHLNANAAATITENVLRDTIDFGTEESRVTKGYDNISFELTSEVNDNSESLVEQIDVPIVHTNSTQTDLVRQNSEHFVTINLSENEQSGRQAVSSGDPARINATTVTRFGVRIPTSLATEDQVTLSVLQSYQPTIGSTIFSFFMTVLFVGVLWVVVFTIFGSKGHAIAGVFLGLFLIGLLLNTCFLKFYFRLRLFLGIQTMVSQQQEAAREREEEEEKRRRKAYEPPPTYTSVIETAPPPYSSATMKPSRESQTLCSLCQCRDASTNGLCWPCKSKLTAAD